jgi:RNA polymerase sigma-70 factor, ECF subfamily
MCGKNTVTVMPAIDESSDFYWIEETLQGNVRSFSNLIVQYQDRIYTIVVRSIQHQEDAKDITQNVFINAFSHLKKFRQECSFQTWLYRIAINQIRNYWRNTKNRLVIAESEQFQSAEKDENKVREFSDALQKFDSDESKQTINELLSFLPLEQRQLFVFHYVMGYSCQEIAEILKTSASNVKIQLYRGRQFLFNKFKNIFE